MNPRVTRPFFPAMLLGLFLMSPVHAGGAPGGGSGGGPGGPGGGMGGAVGQGSSSAQSSATGNKPTTNQGALQASPENVQPEQDKALEAVRADQALPLDQIVVDARHLTQGQIVDVKLAYDKDALLYRLTVLEATGEVRVFYFYAQSGVLDRIE